MSCSPELIEAVKAVHRRFPTGVTIVTASDEGRPYGLAVNAFSSVSLEPPVVLACVAATSTTHPRLFTVDHLGINILAEDQQEVVAAFARSGGDKFSDISWRPGAKGSPLIDGASAAMEIKIEKRLQAYTHTIFTGRVLDATAGDAPPMIYLGGGLFRGSNLTEDRSPGR